MAKVTLSFKTEMVVDTRHLHVEDDDEFADAIRELPEVKRDLWLRFLDEYEILQADWDQHEPDEDDREEE